MGETGGGLTDEAAFLNRNAHAEAVAHRASRYLLEGQPGRAFRFADRRCRLPIVSSGRYHLLRATSLFALGDALAAVRDLHAAAKLDWADPIVAEAMLRRDPDPVSRERAARALLANPLATEAQIDAALRHLTSLGQKIVLRASRSGDRVRGWAVWAGSTEVELQIHSEAGVDCCELPRDPGHRLASHLGGAAAFDLQYAPFLALRLEASTDPGTANPVALYPEALPPETPHCGPGRRAPAGAKALGSSRPIVNVIVPVYRDFSATRDCLEALRAQKRECEVRTVIVNDDSPDPAIRDFVERYFRAEGAHLIVNRVNHGFAASINKALEFCVDGDVLWLNSDVLLPERALLRFHAIARDLPRIGTIVPMSNDGQVTNFPMRDGPNPLPDPVRSAAIDEAAHAANGADVVDLPNGIGYCLYVSRACFDVLGPLSLAYGRGYYEDVDYCLRAREHGYRNVAATGIYVGHASGRSFGDQKLGLVAQNHRLAEQRFPNYTLRVATFHDADPLRPARIGIEERLPPQGRVVLLIGRAERLGPALEERARTIAERGPDVLTVGWGRTAAGTEVTIRAARGEVPQSLAFGLDEAGRAALGRYLGALDVRWIELAEPAAVPAPLVGGLASLGAPVYRFVADLEAAEAAPLLEAAAASGAGRAPLPPPLPPAVIAGSRAITADRMARARSEAPPSRSMRPVRATKPQAPHAPGRPGNGARVIGVPLPVAAPSIDAFLVRLGRHGGLRSSGRTVVVLGRAVDDLRLMASETIFVTGRMGEDEYVSAIKHHGIEALLSPYRTRLFGLIDDLARDVGLPKAYFDWADGKLPCAPGDLAIDYRASDESAVAAAAAWCGATDFVDER